MEKITQKIIAVFFGLILSVSAFAAPGLQQWSEQV